MNSTKYFKKTKKQNIFQPLPAGCEEDAATFPCRPPAEHGSHDCLLMTKADITATQHTRHPKIANPPTKKEINSSEKHIERK